MIRKKKNDRKCFEKEFLCRSMIKLTQKQQLKFPPGISFILSELPLDLLIDSFLLPRLFRQAARHSSGRQDPRQMEEEERRKMRRKRTRRRRKRRRREEREGGRERGNKRFAVVASDCRVARFVVDSSGLDGTISSSGRYYLATANERRRLVAVLVVSFSSSFLFVLAKPMKPIVCTTTIATSTNHQHLSTLTTTTTATVTCMRTTTTQM